MSYIQQTNFNALRAAIANEVTKVTNLPCILQEPETQNVPRPPLPYFAFKLTTPAGKVGYDDLRQLASTATTITTNAGGQRKMTVSFHAYGRSHEEAYNMMLLWQSALELPTIQEDLRRSNIAVWSEGDIGDLSQLLNTGYEGRSHMDVQFGIASNITETTGFIEEVIGTGTVNSTIDVPINVG